MVVVLLYAVVLLPLAILSYFPHQEARFLLPIVAPIILLFSMKMTLGIKMAKLKFVCFSLPFVCLVS